MEEEEDGSTAISGPVDVTPGSKPVRPSSVW